MSRPQPPSSSAASTNFQTSSRHRQLPNRDLNFLSNRVDRAETIEARFRVAGRKAELWDPATGQTAPASYRIAGSRTIVTVPLDRFGTTFVVFRQPVGSERTRVLPQTTEAEVTEVAGPWEVSFQADRGAPPTAAFEKLADFRENSDPGIKYFSGIATYTKEVNVLRHWRLFFNSPKNCFRYNRLTMAGNPISGSLWTLWLYDVCEEIDLDALRAILGVQAPSGPRIRHPSPEYVRFERPPVVQQIDAIILEDGNRLQGELNYYEYGVVSIKLELPFHADWQELADLSSRWMANPEPEARALQTVRRCLNGAHTTLIRPHENWLSEDYYIIHLKDTTKPALTAAELIAEHGGEIARIVRGEQAELSREENEEILGSRLSYYPDDLLVVGWTAAFIHDTAEDAVPTIQLLEYANTQLLEFRYYDAVLSQLLQGVYRSLEKRGGFLTRWRLASQAQHLNTIRLDIRELTERVDTSIKFLSDMFSARLYRLAATKVGVEDYRRLVDGKLHTAGQLYEFMMDQFHQSRAFVLEVLVVIILLIELVFLFRGKS